MSVYTTTLPTSEEEEESRNTRKIITIPPSREKMPYRELPKANEDPNIGAKLSRTIITPPESSKKSTYIPHTKRIITESKTKWAFSPEELVASAQQGYIRDICNGNNTCDTRIRRVKQQIVQKLHGYRSQDIKNGIFSADTFIDLWSVLKKLEMCDLTCFYCKDPVFVLYENVREPTQWTVERIDNTRGHNRDNFEIACLACNLRRRTIHYERYLMTKRLCRISKEP